MAEKPTVLLVDDELQVLEGLALHLRREFTVTQAASGFQALEALRSDPDTAVVVSDLRMPGMDGIAFCERAREVAPDAVRILLTGHADLDAAILVVNQGQIFRFLQKPCAPHTLCVAVTAAERQHRLLTAERVLLEETLRGSISALTDVLALSSPRLFGRGVRVRQLASELGTALQCPDVWQIEVAAMLLQLGYLSLPDEAVSKLFEGQALDDAEQAIADRVPEVAERLLGSIPRLEPVRTLLATHAGAGRVARGAQILRVAIEFDRLEAEGYEPSHVLGLLRSQDRYDSEVLDALVHRRGRPESPADVRDLPLQALRVGMVCVTDVRLTNGALLVARGYEITPSFVERVRNFRAGTVNEPIRVVVPRRAQQEAS